MTWAITAAAVVGAGTSLYASNKQSKAAGNAAQASQDQYYRSRTDLSPYTQQGYAANNTLNALLGLDDYSRYVEHIRHITPDLSPDWQPAPGEVETWAANNPNPNPNSGSLVKPFTGQDLQNEPGYQFEQAEGQKAIDRAASAAGRYDSGATLKALTRYGNDYAGTKYNEAFNRDAANKNQIYGMLSGQQSLGANTAGQIAGLGANATNASNNYLTQGADASAAGLVGASNALSGGVGNYLQYQNNQQTLDYLKGLRNGGIGSGGGWGGTTRTL